MPALNFFHRNRATIFMLSVGVVETFLDNYWVFTSLPMAGDNPADNDVTAKFFYFLAQLVVNSAKDGALGLAIDYLRDIHHQNQNAEPSEQSSLVL